MKKVLLVTSLVLLCVGLAYAQIGYGVRAGLNMANVNVSEGDNDQDARMGFHFGGMMQYKTAMGIVFQPEVLYSQKGYTNDPGGDLDKYVAKLDYIDIPLLVKYNLPFEKFQIQPLIGPQVSINIGAKYKVGDTEDDIEDIKGLDLGLMLGVDGVIMDRFLVGLRYGMGLADIYEEQTDDKSEEVTVKMNNFQIALGYLF